jgi:hypothetical protein
MGKIIRLTESELIDLIKRTINESESVDEADMGRVMAGAAIGAGAGAAYGLGIGAIPGAIAGGLIAYATAGGTGEKVLQVMKYCKAKGMGKSSISLQQAAGIADKINGAIEGLGTNEAAIGAAMRQIKYFPDFCAVANTYQQRHNESLANALDGDIDMEKDWKKYVWLPLLDAINRSQAAGQSIGKAAGNADKIATSQGQALKAKQAAALKAKTPPVQLNQLDKNKVMLIQKKLGLPADGIAGPATTQAIQKYQQQNKLQSINQVLTKLGVA